MLEYGTGGESHGRGVSAIITGMPYGMLLDLEAINGRLQLRQQGFGRGERMALERDGVTVLGGLRRGKTLGSPLVLFVPNRDCRIDEEERIPVPRPGHADLAGLLKLGSRDVGDVMERASARETVGRVVAGSVASQLLGRFGVTSRHVVLRIGKVFCALPPWGQRLSPSLRTAAPAVEARMKKEILRAGQEGDTLGGIFAVEFRGLPPGLGHYASWQERLDGRLAQAVMAIPSVKGVEIGEGFTVAAWRGRACHDPILRRRGRWIRLSNHAGGLEGGLTNGEPLVLHAACKPIPTLRHSLPSVNLVTGKPARAPYLRSDTCVVPAAAVVGEAVVAFELARAFVAKFGGDTLDEVRHAWQAYRKRI